jgi:hypothetical protein
MGAFLTGLTSSVASGIQKKKDKDKAAPKLQTFEKPTSDSSTGETHADPGEFKRGGKVRKTGMAKVHKGEKVLTKRQAKRMERKRGGRK